MPNCLGSQTNVTAFDIGFNVPTEGGLVVIFDYEFPSFINSIVVY